MLNSQLLPSELVGEWEVCESYEIKDGFLQAGGKSIRTYKPQDHPELPLRIAELASGDEKDIIRFAKEWGLFGYQQLWQKFPFANTASVLERPPGDPMGWILAHAKRISVCMGITESLQDENLARLQTFLESWVDGSLLLATPLRSAEERDRPEPSRKHGLEVPVVGKIFRGGFWFWPVAFHLEDRPEEYLTKDPMDAARDFLYMNINSAIEEIAPLLGREASEKGQIFDRLAFNFNAMIEIAYLHVAQLLLQKGALGHCEGCGKYLLQKPRKRRFCPPPPGYTDSICAQKVRNERFYAKKKKEKAKSQ